MILLLDAKKIKELINLDLDVFTFDCVSSTNLLAKEHGSNSAGEALFIADSQTSGRGRMGRSFFSPESSGIYMSLLLRPNINFEDYTLITTAAAVSVARAIDCFLDTPTKIKWVNDVFLNDKKVCGILTEGVFEKDNTFAVLGIGINLYEPKNGFPEDISQIAGGIFTEKCSDDTKTELIAKVINNFYEFYSDLPQKAFLEDYRGKDMLCGKTISYLKNGTLFSGKAQGKTENLELKVIDSFGNTHHLSSGEVTIASKKAYRKIIRYALIYYFLTASSFV